MSLVYCESVLFALARCLYANDQNLLGYFYNAFDSADMLKVLMALVDLCNDRKLFRIIAGFCKSRQVNVCRFGVSI